MTSVVSGGGGGGQGAHNLGKFGGVHRMTNYRGFRDTCVRPFVPFLHFGKLIFHHLNSIKLPKVEKSSTSVVGDKYPAGCNPTSDILNVRDG